MSIEVFVTTISNVFITINARNVVSENARVEL